MKDFDNKIRFIYIRIAILGILIWALRETNEHDYISQHYKLEFEYIGTMIKNLVNRQYKIISRYIEKN